MIGVVNRQSELIGKLTKKGEGESPRVTVVPIDVSRIDLLVYGIDDFLPEQILDVLVINRCLYLPGGGQRILQTQFIGGRALGFEVGVSHDSLQIPELNFEFGVREDVGETRYLEEAAIGDV